MKLVVQRRWADNNCVIGELTLDSVHEAYTLEPATPIPAGTYDLTIRWSPRFGRLMPHIENVPGYEGILIHWGNWARDTAGCLLVGDLIGKDFIGHSRTEFDSLYLRLLDGTKAGGVTISYIDIAPILPSGPGE